MAKSIDFSVFVINRDWEVESIKFPNDKVSIYSIDKVSDLLKKLHFILDVNPFCIHLRGLTIPFDEWIKRNKVSVSQEDFYAAAAKASKVSDDLMKAKKDGTISEKEYNMLYEKELSKELHSSAVKTATLNDNRSSQDAQYTQHDIMSSRTSMTKQRIDLGLITHSNDNIYPQLFYNNKLINTDIPLHAFNQPTVTTISDVPCDNQYIVFKKLVVNLDDHFLSSFAPLNQVVVIKLDEFIKPGTHQSASILQDAFVFERVFYGFVSKYYPHAATVEFQEYLRGNVQPIDDELIDNLEVEGEIFAAMKYDKEKIKALNVKSVINSCTLSLDPHANQVDINLRNLFDKLHISPMSKSVPDFMVQMLYMEIPIENSNKRYVITKNRSNAPNFRIVARYKRGLTLVRALSNKLPEFINIRQDGGWTLTTQWSDSETMNINRIIDYSVGNTYQLIEYINTLTPFFAKEPLENITKENITVSNINVSIFWPKIFSYIEFRLLRQEFNKFIMAGMAENKTSPILEVIWKKGVIVPCVVKFHHRVTDIKIEIIDTNPDDYNNMYTIFASFLTIVDKLTKEAPKTRENESQKLIRKLREQDPQLYDKLKKGNIYSKKCQGFRQPKILTNEEYNGLKASEKAFVTKYWNFTKDTPAYYTCQLDPVSKKPLTLGFLTGIHEDNYCVPCCRRKVLDEMSKHYNRDNQCLKDHTYDKIDKSSSSAYIFVSNKNISEERLGFLPNSVIDILEDIKYAKYGTSTQQQTKTGGYKRKQVQKELENRDINLHNNVSVVYSRGNIHFYARGVPQHFRSTANAGIVYAIADALSMTPADYILGVIKYIKETEPAGISPLLPDALFSIFVENVEFFDWDEKWDILFADLTLEVYDYNVVIFRPDEDIVRVRYNLSPKILIIQYQFGQDTVFYPIYKIDAVAYYKSKHIYQKTFEKIQEIDRLIPFTQHNDLTMMQKLDGVTITKLFINLSNKCYGILAKYKDSEEGYIPVVYSPLISRIPLEYKVFKRSAQKLSLSTSRSITALMNGKTTSTLWMDTKLAENIDGFIKSIVYNSKRTSDPSSGIPNSQLVCIGYVHDNMNVYVNDMTNEELQKSDAELYKLPRIITTIDYDDVNEAISTNRKIPEDLYNMYSEGYYKQHLYKLIKIELLNVIDSGKYKFDTVRQMTAQQIMNIIPHEIRNDVRTDSNILISCSKSNLQHCNSGKLLVPDNFIEYCEVLVKEIHNPVIDFMSNSRSIVINNLHFEKTQGERISITVAQD
jgi:hypothetical protein